MDIEAVLAETPMFETWLRDWLKKIHQLVPPSSHSPPGWTYESLKRLLDGLLKTSATPNLGPRHRAAACNFACAIVDMARIGRDPALDDALAETGALRRLFDVFIERSDVSMTKSMRQVLTAVTRSIKALGPLSNAQSEARSYACARALLIIRAGKDHVLMKPAMQAVNQFLSKGVVELDEVLGGSVNESASVAGRSTRLSSLLSQLFVWLPFNDLALPASQLSTELLKSCRAIQPTPQSHGRGSPEPLWRQPLMKALKDNLQSLNSFRTLLFPALFKIDVSEYFLFLASLDAGSPVPKLKATRPELQTINDRLDVAWMETQILCAALQVGKEIGIVKEADLGTEISFSENIVTVPAAVIRTMLHHESAAVRIAGFSLAVSSPSITLPFSTSMLRTIEQSLLFLIRESDAYFRGAVLALVQQALDRLRCTSAATAKALEKTRSDLSVLDVSAPATQLQAYKNFVQSLYDTLILELQPTASFQSHLTALRVLSMLCKNGLDRSIAPDYFIKQPYVELRWPYELDIFTPRMVRSLLDLLMDPFSEVQQTASYMLSMYTTTAKATGCPTDLLIPFLTRAEQLMLRTGRADHAEGVGHAYAHLYRRLAWSNPDTASLTSKFASQLTLFEFLVSELRKGVDLASTDMVQAVSMSPLHGYLIALRHILDRHQEERDSTGVDHAQRQQWQRLHQQIYEVLVDVWRCVAPVLCNDAPEGYILDDADESTNITTKDTLSYCWRALKESSSLIKTIVMRATTVEGGEAQLLSDTDFEKLGTLCFTQLLELRHRGAFSTVAQAFAACCQRSSQSNDPTAHSLILHWYSKFLEGINEKASALTRRSAGLPAILIGILSADLEGPLLPEAIRSLFDIAKVPAQVPYYRGAPLPQVHAMNCLRAIFTNSKLGPSSEAYILDGLHLAAPRLGSPLWPIRNSALMLFRALSDRMLGTFESGNSDDAIQRSRFSYARYPSLLEILEDLLQPVANDEATPTPDDIDISATLERVFPALHMLQRARPPADVAQRLKSLVLKLTSCPHWHVRDLAARTLVLLTEDRPLLQLWDAFQPVDVLVRNQNSLHGFMLTLNHYVRWHTRSEEQRERNQQEFAFLQQSLHACTETLEIRNICWVTKSAYIDLRGQVDGLLPSKAYHGTEAANEASTLTANGSINRFESDLVAERRKAGPQTLFSQSMPPSLTENMLSSWGSLISTRNFHEQEVDLFGNDLTSLSRAIRASLSEDNTYDLRHATVQCVLGLMPLSKFKAFLEGSRFDNAILDLYLSLFNALNDDDDDIRTLASSAVSAVTGSDQVNVPLYAAHDLARHLLKTRPDSQGLATDAICRLVNCKMDAGILKPSVTSVLALGLAEENALFVQEKQNLYVNHVNDAAFWSAFLKRLRLEAFPAEHATALSAWTSEGLDRLIEMARANVDGALGWSSKPDVFGVGMQVVCATDVLLDWRSKTSKVPISGAELREKLLELLRVGRDQDLHPDWLAKIEHVLESSISKRVTALGSLVETVYTTTLNAKTERP